jgi:hypothetical protein
VTEARQTARNAGWVVAQCVLHVAGAADFVPLAWLKGDWSTNALLFVAASAGYLFCLFRLRIITVAEIVKLGELFRPGNSVPTAA